MSKTITLHGHHAFLYISLPPLHNYDVKCPNFELTGERERQNDKSYCFSLNSGARVPSLQFQTKFPTFKWLCDLVWGQKKNWKNAVREVYFSATLSLASPLSDLFWPVFICFVHEASGEFTDGWKLSVIGPFTRNRSIVSLCSHETDERGYS